ncbi:hypothetical protein PG994_010409 [Apiospora phragmitis]|uniref:Uncharacterized protein n=1 Tax=Apiospora phragmitis TaxID=2905665 RepID=A0ABR1TSF7_9PEZI
MCDCKVKTYKYTACQHRSKTRILCWKAGWRTTNFLCLGQVLTRCRPKKERKDRFGLCTQCTHHFLPYHINDPRYVRKYLKWKEDNGYAGRKVDARLVPLEAVFNVGDKGKLHQQSPMVAARQQPQRSVDSFDLAAAGALSSDYASSARSCSPVRDAGTGMPIDLSDLTKPMSVGLRDLPFRGRAHAGGRMLGLYRANRDAEIKRTLLDPCNERKLQSRVRLDAAPKTARWRRSHHYLKTTPLPSGRSSSSHDTTAAIGHIRAPPPPKPAREYIFMGCERHGRALRQLDCAACTAAFFRERGVPDATYVCECRSAPPCLIQVRAPRFSYTCAPQASCLCEPYGVANCLVCVEKASESVKLQANFI